MNVIYSIHQETQHVSGFPCKDDHCGKYTFNACFPGLKASGNHAEVSGGFLAGPGTSVICGSIFDIYIYIHTLYTKMNFVRRIYIYIYIYIM